MNTYIVYFSDTEIKNGDLGDIKFIKTTSKEEALEIFCLNYVATDENFIDNVYDKSVNMSLAEQFYTGCFNERGENKFTIKQLDNIFKANVRAYFDNAEYAEYAELYINYMLDEKEDKNFIFPSDFMVCVLKKEQYTWSGKIIVEDIKNLTK